MLAGPLPVSILRAAQFHELVGQMIEWGNQGEVSYVPEMRIQPVAARTVAEALADLATGAGALDGPIPEIAGPREESLVDMARLLVSKRGDPVPIEGIISDPSDPDSALYLSGAALPSPHATLAGPTFEQWLQSGA